MGRIKGQGSKWIRPVKRLALYLRDGSACVYCGRGTEDGVVLTLDHVVPCELGGGNEATNLVTACLSCNSSKQDRTAREFRVILLDRGIDADAVGAAIRRQTRRSLDRYLTEARALMAARADTDTDTDTEE